MTANKVFPARTVLSLVCILAVALTGGIRPSLAAMELGAQVRFDIAPQQLPSALLQFSAQSGVQVTSPGQLVEGKKTPGVVGTFTPGRALALLLKDTSLLFDVVDEKTVVITGPARPKVSRTDLRRVSEEPSPGPGLTDRRELRLAQAATTATDLAPSPETSQQPRVMEEVTVTGSSIKRINAETALPIQIMRQEDIARTGATNAEELFHQISAASSVGSVVAAQETGIQTGSISTISLRGLGSERTLVLINGLRSAVYGGGGAGANGNSVDISSIPIAAIERVEILKDGASAVYGSDAIAGVVNFILRSNFQGIEASATAGTPTDKGGGQQEQASVYAGKGDLVNDHYNVGLGVDFEHYTPLMGSDRAFATRYSPGYGNDVTSSFAFPANVSLPNGGGTRNPAVPNCGPNSIVDRNFVDSNNVPTQCRFDNSPYDSLQPLVQKISVMFNGHLTMTDTSQLYTDDTFAQVKTTTTVQPVPLSNGNALLASNPYNAYLSNLLATQYPQYPKLASLVGTGAFLLSPNSPYYPTAFATAHGIDGQPLNLIYRDFANGPRNTRDTADTLRFVIGYKGNTAGWDYDTSLLYNQINVKEDLLSGYALYSELMPLLDQGSINPFGATADPAALAQAQADTFTGQAFETKTSITNLNGRVTRDLMQLPAGPLTGALGVEFRHETFEFDPAGAIQTGDISGEGGNELPISASRNVESAYLELNATLAKGLEVDLAGRYDNYQRVGSTGNPKLSLRWQPTQSVLVRAAAGTGFRAPSLTDLYAPQTQSITSNGTRDWLNCPNFLPDNPACSFQFTTITGGNPHLSPEKSQSYTLGAVFEPVRDLSIDLDSFWIFLRNQITVNGLNYAFIMQSAATEEQYKSYINRGADGTIVSINQTNANLFKSELSGLDMDIKYRFDMGLAGRLTLLGNGTYYSRYVAQNPDGSWTSQLDVGLPSVALGEGGIVSRFRYNATAVYEIGSWGLSLTQNYQKRYHDTVSNISATPRFVSAYQTIDSQVFYKGLQSFKFTLGVRNLFNRDPPYANYAGTANNFVGGYDLNYGDPLGRFVYLTAQYSVR